MYTQPSYVLVLSAFDRCSLYNPAPSDTYRLPGSDGFYGVYRGVFIKLHEDEVQNGSVKAAAPVYSFGSKEFVAKEVRSRALFCPP